METSYFFYNGYFYNMYKRDVQERLPKLNFIYHKKGQQTSESEWERETLTFKGFSKDLLTKRMNYYRKQY